MIRKSRVHTNSTGNLKAWPENFRHFMTTYPFLRLKIELTLFGPDKACDYNTLLKIFTKTYSESLSFIYNTVIEGYPIFLIGGRAARLPHIG